MVYSTFLKQKILEYHQLGHKPPTICRLLQAEGFQCTRNGIHLFLKRFALIGLSRKGGSGRKSKITARIKEIVEEEMTRDDETTAHQLRAFLINKAGITLSLQTIFRCRSLLGWTFRGSNYCQNCNKEKRYNWAIVNQHDLFEDVIYTDECSVQFETHKRFCCRKEGQAPRPKPKAKHPVKVHVWAGISHCGATGVCVFEGIMDKWMYIDILDRTLKPFIRSHFSDGSHRLVADNDPKHTSNVATTWLKENDINWWRTPAESPDMNPIENLWHELKEFIRREVEPKTKQELVDGIERFWKTVTIEKCRRYIGHLKKVIPRVIELKGEATGY